MNFKEFFEKLNILDQCRGYNLSLWQCPQFIFLIMGIIIISSTLTVYVIGNRYIEEPGMVALITLFITLVLFILAFIITRSFERLAEASMMKSEFISIASHELRSPLSNLSWVIELLMSGRIGRIEDRQIEYLRILKENVDRMKELISDLLTVSRIESATLPSKREETYLEELVRELILEFEPLSKTSNIEMKFEAEKNLPKVLVDPSQIKLVIRNLLDNAIRYVKNKGKVEISLARKNKNLYLEVKDNGVGIPRKDQKYIFQKFFRSGNVLKYQTQGTGLGLFIAKAIVEGSGGKIGFQSQENKGSTFYFTLPIK